MVKRIKQAFLIAPVLFLMGFLVYQLPPVKSRLEWRIIQFTADVKHWLFPPEDTLFIPEQGNPTLIAEVQAGVTATLAALIPTSTPTPTPGASTAPAPTETASPVPSPTLTPTPIPGTVILRGTRHEYEQWNNCGPATLGTQLSFWGWVGDQRDTAAFLKPNPRDKNVSPHELVAYVNQNTSFRALTRQGGTLPILKSLIAAGFPTIIEKTLELPGLDGWVGHYALVTGYDDSQGRFITQDSYIQPDYPVPYDKLMEQWQSFNYTLMVVYPAEREAELLAVLGPLAGEAESYQEALRLADEEINTRAGRELFFAWYNRGTSLVGLGDHLGAAAAFDTAFSLYANLPAEIRPWRMTWYQFGPFEAYYSSARFSDVINLADNTILTMGEPTVEETFFWRGLAKYELGDTTGGLDDLRHALELNSNFKAASDALAER
jgi:hypothetical protein